MSVLQKANWVYLKREYAMPEPIIPWQECPHSNCRQQRFHNLFCENSGVKHPVSDPMGRREFENELGEEHPDLTDKRQMEAE